MTTAASRRLGFRRRDRVLQRGGRPARISTPGMRAILTHPSRQIIFSIPFQRDIGRARGLHRLSRAVQLRARAGQGRHPLPSRRDARRGHRARLLDDLEVRGRRSAVRRRQRAASPAIPRRSRSSELERITRRYAAELVEVVGPDKDVPAPDVGHDAADHGVVHGHVLDARAAEHARRRHRQAARDRRLARPRRGDRPRRHDLSRSTS